MPFILSSITGMSISRATDSNSTEQSVNNIAQQPRYRKAILRIGESDYNVWSLNHIYIKLFVLALYPIISLLMNYFTVGLDLFNTIRGADTQMVTYIHCILHSFTLTNLCSSHRASVYLSLVSGLS